MRGSRARGGDSKGLAKHAAPSWTRTARVPSFACRRSPLEEPHPRALRLRAKLASAPGRLPRNACSRSQHHSNHPSPSVVVARREKWAVITSAVGGCAVVVATAKSRSRVEAVAGARNDAHHFVRHARARMFQTNRSIPTWPTRMVPHQPSSTGHHHSKRTRLALSAENRGLRPFRLPLRARQTGEYLRRSQGSHHHQDDRSDDRAPWPPAREGDISIR